MNQSTENGPIKGYFVVTDEEENKVLRQTMQVNNARAGVFYHKKDLLSTLQAHHESFTTKDTHIIEIEVAQKHIATPNGHKFGIKKGCGIPIQGIQTYQEALAELTMETV